MVGERGRTCLSRCSWMVSTVYLTITIACPSALEMSAVCCRSPARTHCRYSQHTTTQQGLNTTLYTLYTTHNTQHNTKRNTTHNTQHKTHNTQHATRNMQHTTRNTQHTTHNTQHTTHNTQQTTHNTQYTTHTQQQHLCFDDFV